jgi:protein-export membrane protein, SecD/SecF family
LNFGIDFKGGILLEVRTTSNIGIADIRNNISNLNIGEVSIQKFGVDSDYLIRVEKQEGSDNAQQIAVEAIKSTLNASFGEDIKYRRLEYVGPTVSKDLVSDGVMAIIFAIIAMLAYIWFRFELPFALGAIVALLHDIILTMGVFAVLGLEFNLATVAAILLIIGYSMNDTVVVYDRIRENLRKFKKMNLNELLDKSINQTLSRTINTTVTTILALGALYIFGGQIIADFAFAMLWGIVVGYLFFYICSFSYISLC